MSKHTEGPWFVTVTTDHGIWVEDGNGILSACRQTETVCVVTNEGREKDQANARLISCAPEMLAMLERIRNDDQTIIRLSLVHDLLELIKKAKGE